MYTAIAASMAASMRSMISDNVGIDDAGEIERITVDELFAGFGSVSTEVTVAVFETDPPAVGAVTTSVNVVEAPLFSVSTEQVIVVVPVHEPAGVAETKVVPGGSTSVTTTEVAAAGPAFATSRV